MVEVLSSTLEMPEIEVQPVIFVCNVIVSDLKSLLARHEGVRRFAYDDATGKRVRPGTTVRVTIGRLPARAPSRSSGPSFDRF